jgi:Ca2+-binding RTX toxin-like protein
MATDVGYYFTYYYGDGEYYKGYGYTTSDAGYYAGQRINQPSSNQTGSTGYYVIDSAQPADRTGYNGWVVVTDYYDKDTHLIADPGGDPGGPEPGHMHSLQNDYSHNSNSDYKLGIGRGGLGSEFGLAHIDHHHYTFDIESFARFNNSNEADLAPESEDGVKESPRPNSFYGGKGNDVIEKGAGDQVIYGGGGNDSIYSDGVLTGPRGNDFLIGGDGNDWLFAGNGNDKLNGGWGDDFLTGNDSETDTMTGGPGADVFSLGYNWSNGRADIQYLGSGHALITDFNASQGDKLRIGGGISDYTLVKDQDLIPSSSLETGIYRNGDLVAILQGTTDVDASRDFITRSHG